MDPNLEKDTNHPTIPDRTPIPYTGEIEEFVDVDITDEEINNMNDCI